MIWVNSERIGIISDAHQSKSVLSSQTITVLIKKSKMPSFNRRMVYTDENGQAPANRVFSPAYYFLCHIKIVVYITAILLVYVLPTRTLLMLWEATSITTFQRQIKLHWKQDSICYLFLQGSTQSSSVCMACAPWLSILRVLRRGRNPRSKWNLENLQDSTTDLTQECPLWASC